MINIDDIGGDIVKEDERYIVKDNKTLNNLVLSSTMLNALCSTTGHSHEGQEEIYFFIDGSGEIEVGDNTIPFYENDIVLIPDGVFHRVHAGDQGCYFVCVFDGKRSH